MWQARENSSATAVPIHSPHRLNSLGSGLLTSEAGSPFTKGLNDCSVFSSPTMTRIISKHKRRTLEWSKPAPPTEQISDLKPISLASTSEPAEDTCEKLLNEPNDYKTTLPPEREVAVMLASFGSAVKVRIERVGYKNPQMIILAGTLDGDNSEVRLVQHVSQLNILLMSLPVVGGKRRAITGFRPDESTHEG